MRAVKLPGNSTDSEKSEISSLSLEPVTLEGGSQVPAKKGRIWPQDPARAVLDLVLLFLARSLSA